MILSRNERNSGCLFAYCTDGRGETIKQNADNNEMPLTHAILKTVRCMNQYSDIAISSTHHIYFLCIIQYLYMVACVNVCVCEVVGVGV